LATPMMRPRLFAIKGDVVMVGSFFSEN